MTTGSSPGGAWQPGTTRWPERLAALVRIGALDAELSALVWMLVEARVSAVVASDDASAARSVRDVLIDLMPDGTQVRPLRGSGESFAWMPEAAQLGWHPDRPPDATVGGSATIRSSSTTLLADLVPDLPGGTWGERALVAIRAVSLGYALLATARGARLEDVLTALAARPVGALDDELTRLGMLLIVSEGTSGVRVVAAHYLRPVSRDPQGHIRRAPPAVLATWDPRTGRFEHFAWGLTDELAGRIGTTPAGLRSEQLWRAGVLGRLAVEGAGPVGRSSERSPAARPPDEPTV